jgi:hypothetical protein
MNNVSEQIIETAIPKLFQSIKEIQRRIENCLSGHYCLSDIERARMVILKVELERFMPKLEESLQFCGDYSLSRDIFFKAIDYQFDGDISCNLIEGRDG